MKKLIGLLFFASMTLGVAAHAQPILDAGWEVDPGLGASDRILAANTDSEDGTYAYNLSGPALFSITDAFIVGDTYRVFDFGVEILKTAFVSGGAAFGDNTTADAGWTSTNYGSGQVLLGAGKHELTIQGDGAGGLPARFFVRLDSVPVPAPTSLALLGFGLVGLLAARRRVDR